MLSHAYYMWRDMLILVRSCLMTGTRSPTLRVASPAQTPARPTTTSTITLTAPQRHSPLACTPSSTALLISFLMKSPSLSEKLVLRPFSNIQPRSTMRMPLILLPLLPPVHPPSPRLLPSTASTLNYRGLPLQCPRLFVRNKTPIR